VTPAEREAYRAANRTELRPPTPWKMAVVRALFVVLVVAMIANVVILVVRLLD
jgi:hypothetical protein